MYVNCYTQGGQLHNVALCADVSCLIVQFYRLTLMLNTLLLSYYD